MVSGRFGFSFTYDKNCGYPFGGTHQARALAARSQFLGFILVDDADDRAEPLAGAAKHVETVPDTDKTAPVVLARAECHQA